jgi:hypothetical protein
MKLVGRGQCCRCSYEEMVALAAQLDARVEIRLRGEQLPAGLENQEQYSGPVGRGYDLFFVYRGTSRLNSHVDMLDWKYTPPAEGWVMWLASLEPECTCGGAARRAAGRSSAF